MSITEPSARLQALEIRVRKTIREFNMILPGEHVLVAVSGGADSTALLLCLVRLAGEFKLSLTVAHLNHRIRGAEGDADADFVRQMSCDLELPLISEVIEVKQQAEATRQNLEELARRRRYDFLRRTAAQAGAHKIAVGHNLGDQAETALFRFIRGSGIEGLSAIHPVVDGLIIRPLLDCSRDLICEYLQKRNAVFREDSTNTDLQHARNRIRLELMPYLQASFNPRLIPTLARDARLARETWDFIEFHAAEAYQTLRSNLQDRISLEIPKIMELHPALQSQVLRQALKECLGSLRGIGSVHIQSLLSLCKTGSSGDEIRIPHGCAAIRQFDSLLLLKHPPASTPAYAYPLEVPGRVHVAEAGATFRCTLCRARDPEAMRKNIPHQVLLDLAALPKSLTIRSRLPGDRYGGPGHRKVKKMLIDSKIPQLQRAFLPMIAAGNDVIWIPGFRPASDYAMKPDTENCLLIEMIW